MDGVVWFAKSFSCLTQLRLCYVEVELSWGFDKIAERIEISTKSLMSSSRLFVFDNIILDKYGIITKIKPISYWALST